MPSTVVGKISFQVDGIDFPGPEWVDRVLVVLASWVWPLRQLQSGQSQLGKLLFGESAHGVIVTVPVFGHLQLRFLEDAIGEQGLIASASVPIDRFLEELIEASSSLQLAMASKGLKLDAHADEFRQLLNPGH